MVNWWIMVNNVYWRRRRKKKKSYYLRAPPGGSTYRILPPRASRKLKLGFRKKLCGPRVGSTIFLYSLREPPRAKIVSGINYAGSTAGPRGNFSLEPPRNIASGIILAVYGGSTRTFFTGKTGRFLQLFYLVHKRWFMVFTVQISPGYRIGGGMHDTGKEQI